MVVTVQVLRYPDAEDGGLSKLRAPLPVGRVYRGERSPSAEARVWIEVRSSVDCEPERTPLPLHLEMRAHSPTGFSWGYGGSGPAQLALPLLVDALGDRELAEERYQAFKWAHVSKWSEKWCITAEEIRQFVVSQSGQNPEHRPPRFSPGEIVATPGVLRRVQTAEILAALRRHLTGDWGELDAHDWQANEQALRDGSRLFSAYVASNQERFWIITEADHNSTTALLPEEY